MKWLGVSVVPRRMFGCLYVKIRTCLCSNGNTLWEWGGTVPAILTWHHSVIPSHHLLSTEQGCDFRLTIITTLLLQLLLLLLLLLSSLQSLSHMARSFFISNGPLVDSTDKRGLGSGEWAAPLICFKRL